MLLSWIYYNLFTLLNVMWCVYNMMSTLYTLYEIHICSISFAAQHVSVQENAEIFQRINYILFLVDHSFLVTWVTQFYETGIMFRCAYMKYWILILGIFFLYKLIKSGQYWKILLKYFVRKIPLKLMNRINTCKLIMTKA